jgi:hypothetical protein
MYTCIPRDNLCILEGPSINDEIARTSGDYGRAFGPAASVRILLIEMGSEAKPGEVPLNSVLLSGEM